MASKIQLRRDSSGNWTATNPVLAEGEMGVELDTNRSKLGDGTSNWVDIPYMTDNNAVGTYDAKYLRKDAGGGSQTVLTTGTTTFNGLVAGGTGFKVTGGDFDDMNGGAGIVNYSGNNLGLVSNGQRIVNVLDTGMFVINTTDIPFTHKGVVNSQSLTNTSLTPIDDAGFSGATTYAGTKWRDVVRFEASNYQSNFSTEKAIGFFGNVFDNTNIDSSARSSYNFYAQGTSPNFFAGSTYIGGTSSRTTRELWESTLTEEQKEQLAAGTLAIPANVSTPGDGSFVRQWWYNQQSAEDQALIDSGELEYPERYQAANFVDTFALGVDTNINLLSNGRGEFSGGVKVTGGSAPEVSGGNTAGAYLTNVNTLMVALNDTNHTNFAFTKGVTITNRVPDDVTDSVGVEVRTDYRDLVVGTANSHTGVFSGLNSGNSKIVNFKAFSSEDVEDYLHNTVGATGYGFYSNNQHADAKPNATVYNFFADGNAPNFFRGPSTVSNNPNFDYNSNNNSTQLGTTISPGGFLLNRFTADNALTVGCQIKRLGNADVDTATHAIASFLYGDYRVDDTVVVAANIKMDGSGGIILDPTSDYRAKENIVDLPSAVNAIKALRPVNYNYTWAPGRTRPGFVAHEIQETLPVAVTGTKDATEAIGTLADYDGTVLETGVPEPPANEQSYVTEEGETRVKSWTQTGTRPVYQGVDQTKLIPLLTKALQEALERIEELESGSGGGGSELESRLSTLEADMDRIKAI